MNKYKRANQNKYHKINPKIIPRNHIIEKIISESYSENYETLHKFKKIYTNPYSNIYEEEFLNPPSENEKVYQTFCGT